jgi:hypothetical protein
LDDATALCTKAAIIGAAHRALVAAEPTPLAWTAAFGPHKIPGQMALVDKTASERDLRNREITLKQQLLCPFYTALHHPSMRRHAGRVFESTGKMAFGQAAFPREVCNRRITVKMSIDEFADSSQLPRRKRGTGKTSIARQTAIGAQNMCVEGDRNGIYEQRCRVGRFLKCPQKRYRQSLHYGVWDSP